MNHILRRLRAMKRQIDSLPSKRPQAVEEVYAEIERLITYVSRQV